MSMNFTPVEKKILAMAQGDLPDSPEPYADIAKACGASEEKVLELLNGLLQTGAIRRFGASLAHNRAGWDYNAMVAWKMTAEEASAAAGHIKTHPHISHAYLRPSPGPSWPYSFYTMIHARSESQRETIIADLATAWQKEYAVLRTLRELKKTSPVFFD